jgi:NADPH2:quinone reductase
MKAIRVNEFGGPEVMRLEDVPDPAPGPGDVVVRVRAAGVNPVDTYIRAGAYGKGTSLPYTPGSDAAGDIVALGAEVKGLAVGDRVYAEGLSGAYAQQAACPAQNAHPLPESASHAQGAAIGVPYATAYRALFQRAQAKPGDIVLVHGASGGVGLAAVQFAVAAGMIVIGTAGTEEGMALLREQGVHYPFNHHEEGYLQRVMEVTMGKGVDVILEMLANVNLGKDLGALAKRGRVAVIGSRGKVEIDPRDLMGREADIRGVMLGHATAAQRAATYAAITAGLKTGTLNPVIGAEVPLAEASRAHVEVMEGGHHGKVVLTV